MARMLGKPQPTCNYTEGSYYSGGCKCGYIPKDFSLYPSPAPPAPVLYHCVDNRCVESGSGGVTGDECRLLCGH
eukprot:gene1083-6301_t